MVKRKPRKMKSRKKKGGSTCSNITNCSRCVSHKKRRGTPCLWNNNKTPKCRSKNIVKGRSSGKNGWTNNCPVRGNVKTIDDSNNHGSKLMHSSLIGVARPSNNLYVNPENVYIRPDEIKNIPVAHEVYGPTDVDAPIAKVQRVHIVSNNSSTNNNRATEKKRPIPLRQPSEKSYFSQEITPKSQWSLNSDFDSDMDNEFERLTPRGGYRKRKTRKIKLRKRNSRKKRGGSVCRTFSNDCNGCINNNTPRCVFNSSTKECSKQTLRKRGNRSWSRSCDINDLPLAEAVAEGKVLRVESLGGTPFVEGLREGSKEVPIPGAVDAGISLEERARIVKSNAVRRLQLRNRNGTVNNNSTYEGTPCFTQCEHKGWCEAGVKGACDWENYCYPSNNSGDSKMEGVDKQYCDKPQSMRRPRYVGDGRVRIDMDNILPFQGGRKRKSRRRKSRRRKSRRRKSHRRKSRRRKSHRRKSRRRKSRKRKKYIL